MVRLHRRDLAVGTLASVLRQAEMDGDSFIQPLMQLTGLALLDHREVADGGHQLGITDRSQGQLHEMALAHQRIEMLRDPIHLPWCRE